MGIHINISSNISSWKKELKQLRRNDIVNATKRSLNRSMTSTRKTATIMVKDHYRKLKSGEIKRDYMHLSKAKGRHLSDLETSLGFSPKPVPLINLVYGSKQPRAQAGKKRGKAGGYKGRSRITIGLKGKRFKLKRAFIARIDGAGEATNVFKREPGGSKIYRQSAPSVGRMMAKEGVLKRLSRQAVDTFDRNIHHELDRRLEKRLARLAKKKL